MFLRRPYIEAFSCSFLETRPSHVVVPVPMIHLGPYSAYRNQRYFDARSHEAPSEAMTSKCGTTVRDGNEVQAMVEAKNNSYEAEIPK